VRGVATRLRLPIGDCPHQHPVPIQRHCRLLCEMPVASSCHQPAGSCRGGGAGALC
jgi:hypothetical protein